MTCVLKIKSINKNFTFKVSFSLLNVEAQKVSFPPLHNEEQNYPARRLSVRVLNYIGKKNDNI